MDLHKTLQSAIESTVAASVTGNRTKQEIAARVESSLSDYFVNDTRKKPLEDIEIRVEAMLKRIHDLSENIEIKLVNNKLVVKAEGRNEETLRMLRLGTNWFDGNQYAVETILRGLFE